MVNKERAFITDRGYSWLVMLSTFILLSLYSGNFTAHGIFLLEFVDYFRVNTAEAAVAGSLAVGISGIIGIILGPLTKQFGTRVIVMSGGVLSGVGITAASFSGNLQVVNIFLGVLPGIGTGCYLIGGTVATLEYFDKRRSLAFGIAVTGYTVGTIASPQIMRLLVREFGWRGAMLIQGSIQFNGLVRGALLRPQLKPQKQTAIQKKSATGLKKKIQLFLDFTVFKDVKYAVYIFGVSLNKTGHNIPFMFLPARAESTGTSKLEAATLITLIAACSFALRPLYGYIGDRLGIRRTLVHALAGIFCGALHSGSYFLYSYTLMAIYAGMVGVLSGMTVDITGNYATPFLVFGLVQSAGGVCSCIIYLLQRRNQKQGKPNDKAEEVDA